MIANQMDIFDWAIAVVGGVQLDVGLLGEDAAEKPGEADDGAADFFGGFESLDDVR